MASPQHERLCSTCGAHFDAPGSVPFESKGFHHTSYYELEEAADAGCYICVRISLNVKRSNNFLRGDPVLISLRYRLLSTRDERVRKLVFDVRLRGFKVESTFLIFQSHHFPDNTLKSALSPGSRRTPWIELAKNWLSECRAHHKCQKDPILGHRTVLPTRLLRVDCTTAGLSLRLCYGWDMDDMTKYLTLSHRWESAAEVTLTKENHDDFLQGIPYASLSNTFQDVLRITLQLGFKHLWIDSLCIIQNDQKDWEIESGRMAWVYRNAVCNLCAAITNTWRYHPRLNLNPNPPKTHFDESSPRRLFTLSESMPWGLLRDAELYSRAWVLQEQILVSYPTLQSTHN